MKSKVLFLALLLGGCGSSLTTYVVREYKVGQEKTVTVGSTICAWESGQKGKVNMTPVKSGVRSELVYNGCSDSTIFVAYREFNITQNDAFARAAFANELKYTLRGNKVITYRDLIIEILEAGAQSIRFRVVADASTQPPQDEINALPKIKPLPAVQGISDRYLVRVTMKGGLVFTSYFCGETETAYKIAQSPDSNEISNVAKAGVANIERVAESQKK